MKAKRPPKAEKVLETAREHVLADRYLDTRHATDRKNQRTILRSEIREILLGGFHEKARDRYDELHMGWSYSVRGRTADRREIRVVFAFDAVGVLFITAIELTDGGVGHGD